MARRRTVYAVAFEGGLNVREAPSKSARILAVLPFGREVRITNEETPDGWVALYDGGYVMSQYLR